MRDWAALLLILALCSAGCSDGSVSETAPPPLPETTATRAPVTTASSEPPSTTATSTVVPSTSTTMSPPLVEPPLLESLPIAVLGISDVVEESPGLVRIDSDENPVWNAPGLFQFPDGRLRVVYAFRGINVPDDCGGPECVIDEETRVRMATCLTPECAQVEIVEFTPTRFAMSAPGHTPESEAGWMAFDADGVPFVTWMASELGIPDDERLPLSVLMTCTDPTCSEAVYTTTREYDRWDEEGRNVKSWSPMFVATPNGDIAVLGHSSWVPDPDVWEGWNAIHYSVCDETLTCLRPEAGSVLIEGAYPFGLVDALRVGFTAAGNPVVSYRELSQPGQRLLTCTDTLCTGTLPKARVGSFNVSDWPGGIHITEDDTTYLALEEWTEPDDTSFITVSHCTDPTCTESVTTELNSFPAGSYTPFASTHGDDNLPRLVWTTREGFEYARCLNTDCTDYEIIPTGIPAKHVSIITGLDGNTIIGLVDETGVSIYRCTNPSCTPNTRP